jgi:hypothetical protein
VRALGVKGEMGSGSGARHALHGVKVLGRVGALKGDGYRRHCGHRWDGAAAVTGSCSMGTHKWAVGATDSRV